MPKLDYEIAADEFIEAEAEYKHAQAAMLSGDFVKTLIMKDRNDEMQDDAILAEWQAVVTHVQTLLENRNAKAKEAANALRQAVMLAPTNWRGPDGKPSKLNYGPFTASSVTHRHFDPETLINRCQEKGILERLLQLKFKKADGSEVNSVRQEWEIDYESTLKWLVQNNFGDIVKSAYDETEKTPQVSGAKLVAFLGDIKG